MKSMTLRLCIAVFTFFIGVSIAMLYIAYIIPFVKSLEEPIVLPCSQRLSMELSAQNTSLRVGERPKVQVTITNLSDDQVVLVHPGDGSTSGWRTPVVNWSVVNVQDKAEPSSDPMPSPLGCGNINPLNHDEVFTLVPGESKELKWISLPQSFRTPGVYEVVFIYANRPSLEWKGEPVTPHNEYEMWRVKHSTECSLISNEVTFTVNE